MSVDDQLVAIKKTCILTKYMFYLVSAHVYWMSVDDQLVAIKKTCILKKYVLPCERTRVLDVRR